MRGIKRVLVFCTLTTVLPTMLLVIPLYLRHSFYANVVYAVTESDIMEINDRISTIFCSEHTLQMNDTFNAFQMAQRPEITSYRKHIRLKKSMNLPDDTLEYWGFYLLKGATVALSVCSRFPGASILVVKGERNLRTCGMLEHNINKGRTTGMFLPKADQQVKITFESYAQEINSKELLNNVGHDNSINLNSTSKQYFNQTKEDGNMNFQIPNVNKMDTSTNANNASKITNTTINKELATLFRTAETYIQKHIQLEQAKNKNITRKLRHAKRRIHRVQIEKEKKEKEKKQYEYKLKKLLHENNLNKAANMKKLFQSQSYLHQQEESFQKLSVGLNLKHSTKEDIVDEQKWKIKDNLFTKRPKRSQEPMKPPSLLDQGIKHGGNADRNTTDETDTSSVSSFESGLLNCYEGAVLLAEEFEPSDQCINISYLITGKHIQTQHSVIEDGYYYYIFYSDNDIVSNDIHAVFDIYKPTFQYENVTKSCINETECTFSLTLMSADRVIIEIPTKDGIDHGKDDMNLLVSICHPRMGIYMIFPIAVLFLVLGCAFM